MFYDMGCNSFHYCCNGGIIVSQGLRYKFLGSSQIILFFTMGLCGALKNFGGVFIRMLIHLHDHRIGEVSSWKVLLDFIHFVNIFQYLNIAG